MQDESNAVGSEFLGDWMNILCIYKRNVVDSPTFDCKAALNHPECTPKET